MHASCIGDDPGAYLWQLYLLYGANHVCCFFAPIALNNIALNGCAIDGYNGMSCCFMGVEPAYRKDC